MVSTKISQEAIHPDTKAVLLLCGTFAKRKAAETPLNLAEYNALASWLSRQGRRPASLLQTSLDPFPVDEAGLPRPERVRALLDRGFQMAAVLEGWQRLGLWVISRGEECYPERLRRNLRAAAPPLLYGAGDINRLTVGGLAVVGSRNIDEEGLSFAQRVGERCAGEGVQLISGGARGVDRAAMNAALEAGGAAVAVLAERLDSAATTRGTKDFLRSGLLTLVTPYHPESTFNIGNAMDRNKNIYALADRALIVRFTTEKGGTWAGAIEQLDRNQGGSVCVPVFVRVANNPEDGCAKLQSKGATAFPEEDFWRNNIADVLNQTTPLPQQSPTPSGDAEKSVESEEVVSPSLPDAPLPSPLVAETETCYHRCLPLLLLSFQQEIGTKNLPEIAEKLQLLPKQLEIWLQRAIAEGKLAKKKKKGRVVYVAGTTDTEQTLFDRAGDTT